MRDELPVDVETEWIELLSVDFDRCEMRNLNELNFASFFPPHKLDFKIIESFRHFMARDLLIFHQSDPRSDPVSKIDSDLC